MRPIQLLLICLIVALCAETLAEEPIPLKDPRLRNEDISGTEVAATVERLPNGFYEYRYDIQASQTNNGDVFYFAIEAGCSLDFGDVQFPEPPFVSPRTRPNASRDGQHVPAQIYPVVDSTGQTLAGPPTLSFDNKMVWPLGLRPGDAVLGLRVLSPAPPALRPYALEVSMSTGDINPDGSGWAYTDESGDDPLVPWVQDFRVTGMITAPACALPDDPPPPEPAVFLGTNHQAEPEAINGLLTYSTPLRDRLHVAADAQFIEMTIHYAENIDPKTFKVQPGWARNFFNPQPGTTETIMLPLRDKKSLFKLEVHPTNDGELRPRDEFDQSYKDKDLFEIRREGSKTPPGRDRNKE
jgi:hypothetical protein